MYLEMVYGYTGATQLTIISALTQVIDDLCSGPYAVNRQFIADEEIVFSSMKPSTVPSLIVLGEEAHHDPFMRSWLRDRSTKSGKRKTLFYDGVTRAWELSKKAAMTVKALQGSENGIRREALAHAEKASNAKKAGDVVEGGKEATFAGLLLARLKGGEDLLLSQGFLSSGASMFVEGGSTEAGATVAGIAAGVTEPWNRADELTRELRRDSGRMWTESVFSRDDPSTELDRIFLGLVNAPEHDCVRLLMLRLAVLSNQSEDPMIEVGSLLRFGLMLAKSGRLNSEDWENLFYAVDNALAVMWDADAAGRIDLDDMWPELETTEEVAYLASSMAYHADHFEMFRVLQLRYAKIIESLGRSGREVEAMRMEKLRDRYLNRYLRWTGTVIE